MANIKVNQWSFFGRLRDLFFKLISLKGVAFGVVLWAVVAGRIDALAGLGFVALLLGIREYGKGKFDSIAKKILEKK